MKLGLKLGSLCDIWPTSRILCTRVFMYILGFCVLGFSFLDYTYCRKMQPPYEYYGSVAQIIIIDLFDIQKNYPYLPLFFFSVGHFRGFIRAILPSCIFACFPCSLGPPLYPLLYTHFSTPPFSTLTKLDSQEVTWICKQKVHHGWSIRRI